MSITGIEIIKIFLFLVHFGAICTSIVVTGDDFGSVKGIYYISEEKSVFSPAKPTYKHIWMDRYIYFYPDDDGWLLGDFMGLSTGTFKYKSKICLFLMIILVDFIIIHNNRWC